MKKTRILSILIFAIALMTCLTLFSACSDDDTTSTRISSAETKDGTVTVTASLDKAYAEKHSGERLYILALSSIDPEGGLGDYEIVSESKVGGKMTFKFPLVSDSGSSRVNSAFVLAEKISDGYSALTNLAYISNPEAAASYDKKPNSTLGIKGYFTEDVYGSKLLGAEQIMLEAQMNKLILSDFEKGAVQFNYDGISYYYDKDEVERLDKLAQDADSAKMRIFMRTVLKYGGDPSLDFLYFNGANDASGYLPDLSNERAVRYTKAFYAFLASRYPVADFIIGERVNDFSEYCNAGRLSGEEFELVYSFWSRLAHQTLRAVNSSAAIYIPIDNAWRIDVSASKTGAKAFLTRFAEKAKNEGDYDYAVALNLGDGDDYAALVSGKNYDYTNIGVTNLSDLTKFLENTEMRYQSDKRRVIIDSLSLSTDIREKDRASYYTYAYYSALENGFESFFYSSSTHTADGSRSDLYYAMLMCGTSLNSQLKDYTSSIPAVSIPDFDSYVSTHLTYEQSAELDIDDKLLESKKPLSIPIGKLIQGGGVYNIQGKLNEESEKSHVSWVIGSEASRTGAVSAINISAEDIISAAHIGLTIGSEKPSTASLIITLGDRTYIGEAAVSDTEKTYYFDISEFAKEAKSSDELSLSICLSSSGDGDVSYEIREISLYGSSGNGAGTVITIIIVVAVILVLLGLIVLLVVKRKKKTAEKRRGDD